MSGWTAIRRLAVEKRSDVSGRVLQFEKADHLVDAALSKEGLWSQGAPAGDPALSGAQALLNREAYGILYNQDLSAETVAFNLAHELAHWYLHDDTAGCNAEDINADSATDALPYGEAYVSGYSPAQKRETEANVFAAAFLLPPALLREAFSTGVTPAEVANRTGVAEGMVLAQLAEALLQPDSEPSPVPEINVANAPAFDLDESQKAAAEVSEGPTLVVAGPGTGKTRTLVSRIQYLLKTGTRPEHILALTFSNKAANEMRERVAQVDPDAARRIWMGTFHSFGLELLRRFGDRIGLPPRPTLLDPLDAIALLERHVAELNLRELEYLHNPSFPFRDILSAISRAKDELVTPGQFNAMAAAVEYDPEDERAKRAATRLAETAGVYEKWEELLREEGRLDFADLILRSVDLLREHSDVRQQIQSEYRHILVDEYQDINRASAIFVKEIAGDGKGLWVVGDLRQAIYGFRGAAPANVTEFSQDFPGAREMSLNVNYRSRAPIVQVFAQAADAMAGERGDRTGWQSIRGDEECSITYAEAKNETAQAIGMASMIRSFHESGIALHNQAILCRTNSQAAKLATALEQQGVPVVYLGALFTRPEIRDMLSLLSLACEAHGQGLARIASMPEYAASTEDVTATLNRARSLDIPFPRALEQCGVEAFERLHSHIEPIAYKGSAFAFFSRYLFGPARYLRDLLAGDSIQAAQSRLALHQLLQMAREHAQTLDAGEENLQRAFLDHIRRLLATQEDGRARLPSAVEGMEGVRLLTVHGSKGLEFPVVFLPNLAKDLFPARGRTGMITLPGDIVAEQALTNNDEEMRLFFVALSRAKDQLVLSRPLTVNGKPRHASPLLKLISESLVSGKIQRVKWSEDGGKPELPNPEVSSSHPPVEVSLADIEQYMRCPRLYYYQRVLHLPKSTDTGLYRSFQRCLQQAIAWLRQQMAEGKSVGSDDMDTRLTELWNEHVSASHIHNAFFFERARAMMGEFREAAASEEAQTHVKSDIEEITANFAPGRIRIKLDHARESADGRLQIEQYNSRPSDKDHVAPVLALTRFAAMQMIQDDSVQVKLRYLASGETREVPEQPRWEPGRIAKYEKALEGIREGEFTQKPTPDNCATCPFFFICPT